MNGWNKEYDILLSQLRKIFSCEIDIKYVKPCHDDDFEEGYAIVVDGVIVGNPEFSLTYNADNIYRYLMRKSTKNF